MAVAPAALALLFDVADFAAGGHLAISADHAPTSECGEAEKPNETHDALHRRTEQVACRRCARRAPKLGSIRGPMCRRWRGHGRRWSMPFETPPSISKPTFPAQRERSLLLPLFLSCHSRESGNPVTWTLAIDYERGWVSAGEVYKIVSTLSAIRSRSHWIPAFAGMTAESSAL